MTISRLRIVPKNDFDAAALTVSPAAEVGFEVTNTQNTRRDDNWRSTSTATQTITAVFPNNRTLSHASMWGHLNHAGNWRVELFSDAGATSSVLNATGGSSAAALSYTATEPYVWSEGSNDPLQSNSPTWVWFAETVARSMKVTFSGTPGQAYFLANRIYVGRYLELAVNPSYGAEFKPGDLTSVERTQGGSNLANPSQTWKDLTFDLERIPDNQFATWYDIMEYAGKWRDVVVSMIPGDGSRIEALRMICGKFAQLDALGRRGVNRNSKRVQIVAN